MIAASYGRKSTNDEASVERQTDLCHDFIRAQGWTIGPDFTDNDVSGGVFDRPGLNALLAAVEQKPRAFDALVMMESSRLGREMAQTLTLQLRLVAAGVRIFHYQDGQELLVNTPTQKLVAQVNSFGAEDYKHQIGLKTTMALRKNAERGWQTGAVPFGYGSVAVGDHKELRVDAEQAAIVRQIFTWSSEGVGITRIAHRLSREYPGLRKWSATGIRDLLKNPLYAGRLVHGRRSRPVGSTTTKAPALPPVTKDVPELRIVPDPLWRRVEQQRATVFSTYLRTQRGRLTGRPEMKAESKYLLSGFVQCGACGGRMVAIGPYLRCWRNKSRGAAVCTNNRPVRLDELTPAIVSHFRRDVLTTDRIRQIGRDLAADAEQAPEKVAAQKAALSAKAQRLGARLANLADAVAEGGNVPTLVAAIKDTEADQRAVAARLAALEGTQQAIAEWSADGHDERITSLLGGWQAALEAEPVVGRQILKKLLVGPIVVTPTSDGSISYRAEGSYSRLLTGVIGATEIDVYTMKPRGMVNAADLGAELMALAKKSGGRPRAR